MTQPGHPPGLDSPLRLACGLVLPNRIAKAAMTECLADPGTNDPNERHVRLYRRWADGGLGLSITGNVMVDRRYLERTSNVVLDDRTDAAVRALLIFTVVVAIYLSIRLEWRMAIGAIVADNFYTRHPIDAAALRSLQAIGNLAALAIDRARLHARTVAMAEVDGLTGVYNRHHPDIIFSEFVSHFLLVVR